MGLALAGPIRVYIRMDRREVDMRFRGILTLLAVASVTAIASGCNPPSFAASPAPSPGKESAMIKLPGPKFESQVSIEETLANRRSVRGYRDELLTLAEISQLLWAAQGITGDYGFRTAPSAGALYPLEVYVVAGNVSDLPAGVYRYVPDGNGIVKVSDGDLRNGLAQAALGQSFIADAPASFVFSAVYERTTRKYGDRGERYVHMEAGHAAENLLLQGVALGIGAVTVGAFDDGGVADLLALPGNETPLYIIAAGKMP